MAIYTIYPVIYIDDLEKAVNAQYDTDLDLRDLLFVDGSEYVNGCCKRFYYEELETYAGFPWQDEQHITEVNLIKSYLQDILPDYSCVLLEISW